MRLLIKQRVFAWTDTFDIYDEMGNPKYYVKAQLLAIGHVLHVYDTYGNEIGVIRQKVLNFMPTFEIEIEGNIYGRIQQKISLFRPKYEIDFCGWRVEGDYWGWNYDVYDGGRYVLGISKELFRWGDTYVIDIMNPADELLGMMLVIAIDAANCSRNND